jgi:hypothetical protein
MNQNTRISRVFIALKYIFLLSDDIKFVNSLDKGIQMPRRENQIQILKIKIQNPLLR